MKKRMALTKCNKKKKIKMIKNLRKKFIKNVKVGSGLTVNLRNMMNESMSKGNEFVMIDGKGDMESLIEVLYNSNREKDVFLIDFTTSKKSQSIKIEPQNMQ